MNRTWPALILAPLFALASISLGYALVTPACERSGAWLVHVVVLLFLALSVASTVGAWLSLQAARREFLPLVSTWSGAFFSALILLQWLALFIVSPCTHSP
jgi:hypothetical protein